MPEFSGFSTCRKWVVVASICAVAAGFADRVSAATVMLTDPACTTDCVASGITGLSIAGTDYDVHFEYEDIEIDPLDVPPDAFTPPIVTEAFAIAATNAILAAFQPATNPGFIRATEDTGSTIGPEQQTFYFLTGPVDISTTLSPVYVAVRGTPWSHGPDQLGQSSSRNFVILTPADNPSPGAIPLPAALPTFGIALAAFGFIGWRRRRHSAM